MPALSVTETGDRVRLHLGDFARGEGASLQEAADDLIRSILRAGDGIPLEWLQRRRASLHPDLETMNFLYELGEIAAAGGDIRSRVFA